MLSPTLRLLAVPLLLVDLSAGFQPEFLQMIKQRADLTNNVRRPSRFRCRHPISANRTTTTGVPDLPLMLPSIGRGSISFSRSHKATGSAMRAPRLDATEMELVRRILTEDFPKAMAAGRAEEPPAARKRISADGKVPKKAVETWRPEFTSTTESGMKGTSSPVDAEDQKPTEPKANQSNRTQIPKSTGNPKNPKLPKAAKIPTESLLPRDPEDSTPTMAANSTETKFPKIDENTKSLKAILFPKAKVFQRPPPRPLDVIGDAVAERPKASDTQKIAKIPKIEKPEEIAKTSAEESAAEKPKSTTKLFVLAPSTDSPLAAKTKPPVEF